MGQIWVAFGQGTGATRVSQKAVMVLYARYFDHIGTCGVVPVWGAHALQVLERIRTIGRVAALNALGRGDSTISEADVIEAIDRVELESDTEWCPPRDK